MTVRVYYLEEPLGAKELQFIGEAFTSDDEIEQIRVPFALPALREGVCHSTLSRYERRLRKCLKTLGIAKDRGQQVLLVAPKNMDWYAVLLEAVAAETGLYPYLVQTEAQREAIGNPGATRILDTHGLIGSKGDRYK